MAAVDPGFDPAGLLHARVSLPPEKYRDPVLQRTFYERLIDALDDLPGVTAAGAVNVPPGVGGGARPSVRLDDDRVPSAERDLREANLRIVTPGYFETLGVAARSGRLFSPRPAFPAAVVNEAFVRRHFDGRLPLDRGVKVTFGGVDRLDPAWRTIVGVVPDMKENTLYAPAPPTVYLPLEQADWRVGLRMALLVRTSRVPGDLIPAVRAAVAGVDAEQAASGFMPLGELMQSELSLNRLNLALLSVLSAVGLFLSSIGVYGLSAQAVRHRTPEIGIRLALGLPPEGVVRLFVRDGAILVLIGLGTGTIVSFWSDSLLRSAVHGVGSTSAGTLIAAATLLAAALLAGSYLPARRAARIDPALVLRAE